MHGPDGIDRAVRDFVRDRPGGAAAAVAMACRPLTSRKLLLPLGAAIWFIARRRGDAGLEHLILDCGRSVVATALFLDAIKRLLPRERPDGGHGGPGRMRSFPSGHAGNAFALAAVLHAGCGRPWLGRLIYAVAIGGALGRIRDERHWASDVLVGAAVGHLVGRRICRQRRVRRR